MQCARISSDRAPSPLVGGDFRPVRAPLPTGSGNYHKPKWRANACHPCKRTRERILYAYIIPMRRAGKYFGVHSRPILIRVIIIDARMWVIRLMCQRHRWRLATTTDTRWRRRWRDVRHDACAPLKPHLPVVLHREHVSKSYFFV